MQETSAVYRELRSDPNSYVETRLTIGESGVLATEQGDRILFGGVNILVATSGADSGYAENVLKSVTTSNQIFQGDVPMVGGCVSGEIDVEMLSPVADIPVRARMALFVRLVNESKYSEWLPKGVYFIDTRQKCAGRNDVEWLTIHGYDDMMKAEMDYPNSTLQFPARDVDVVNEIAKALEVAVDPRTYAIMTAGYLVQYPSGYCSREVLGYIASMYGGSFIMNESGELRLIQMFGIPAETRYLIDESGYSITFGGDRILV